MAKTYLFKNKGRYFIPISGFTLIETAIAIFISILVITSSLYAFNRGLSLMQTARNINIAASDISAVCETLRQEVDLSGTVLPRAYLLPNINNTETVNIAVDTTQSPMPVNVTIGWQDESQRQRSIAVDMLIGQRQKA